MSAFRKLFLEHPATVDESYFEHLAFAFRFSARLFRMSLAAFIHGVIPAAFETTASGKVLLLAEEIRTRRLRMAEVGGNAGFSAQKPAG